MAYVIKIKYGNNLRRLTLQHDFTREDLSFGQLETRIQELFQLQGTDRLLVTYVDQENDVVTMANDQDVRDALVHQSLNPLRLTVTLVNSGSNLPEDGKSTASDTNVPSLQHLLQSPGHIPEFVDNILQTIASQLSSAVRNGTEAAAASSSSNAAFAGAAASTPGAFEPPQIAAYFKNLSCQATERSRAANESSESAGTASGPHARGKGTERDGSNTEGVVHHGVGCDVCEASPIIGIRWKSNKKYDYDLCSNCFEKHGNENEYTKIEQPMFRPRHFYGLQRGVRPNGGPLTFQPMGPCVGGRPFGFRGGHGGCHCGPMVGHAGKLDARFVCDVTMFDATEVAPGTHFTKIWRLRNSGTLPWPVYTSLVLVGGDDMGAANIVPLEIPEQGLAPEEEMEVSIDLVAPEKPGRYISHWRLASPAGPKFGHRIGVHVQVVPKETLDQAVELELLKPVASAETSAIISNDEGLVTYPLVNGAASRDREIGRLTYPVLVEPVTYPPVDGPAVELSGEGRVTYPVVHGAAKVEEADLSTSKALLAKLETMGFTDGKLNLELLEKNDMDLRRTLDDLCAAEEWDPILEQLEEMGFYDTDMNRRLMFKNKGSVKHVVKELVQINKDLQEMGKKVQE